MLKTQLSQLEVVSQLCMQNFYIIAVQNLPKMVNQLHQQLLVAKTEANNMVSARNIQMIQLKDVTSQPDSLQDDQSTQQTDMSDTPMVY